MIHAAAKVDKSQCLLWRHGIAGDFSDERYVLAGSQRGNKIIKLKHEPNVIAAVCSQSAITQAREFVIQKMSRP